jgi:hypothetical protein
MQSALPMIGIGRTTGEENSKKVINFGRTMILI